MKDTTYDVMVMIGQLTDTSPTHICFDKLYQPLFVCYYGMYNMAGNIDTQRVLEYHEPTYSSVLMNGLKLIKRTVVNVKNIIAYRPKLVITLHDYQLMALLPTVIVIKVLYTLRLIRQKPKFLGEILNNPVQKYGDGIMGRLSYSFYTRYDILTSQTEANVKNILHLNPKLSSILEVYPNRTDFKYFNTRADDIGSIDPEIVNYFDSGINFVTIGRNTEQKGQWFMIRAFAEVVKDYPDAHLYFIGKGEMHEQLKELVIDLGVENNIHFLGRLPNPLALLKLADYYLMTSLREGMPNTILEAISVNTLCLSTDCANGPREILCPELSYDDPIGYPYYGKYGVLFEKLPRSTLMQTIDETPLISQEQLIVATLKNLLANKEQYDTQYSTVQERGMQYDRSNHAEFRKGLLV